MIHHTNRSFEYTAAGNPPHFCWGYRPPQRWLRFLNYRETVSENMPRVNHFKAQRDLVMALQVTPRVIRVAIRNYLERHLLLDTPTDALIEVTNDGANTSISGFRAARNRIRNRSANTLKRGNVDSQTKFRELLTPIGVTRRGDRPGIRRIQSDPCGSRIPRNH